MTLRALALILLLLLATATPASAADVVLRTKEYLVRSAPATRR